MSHSETPVSRRKFNGLAGLVGAGAFGATLSPWAAKSMDAKSTGLTSQELTVDEMDAYHEAGVMAFPAETKVMGNQPLEHTMDGDVKVFELTCDVVPDWEFDVDKTVEAWCYNGMTPGPVIRVTEGDKLRFNVTNNLPESTAIHWHGLVLPNDQDGVPYLTQPPIKPGETFTYEFTAAEGNAGSHMYHSHHNSAKQVTMGLLGAFIIDPKDESKLYENSHGVTQEYIMVLNDGPIGGYSINGKGFPATEPLVAKKGEKILVRYMNEGLMHHPMHLHGMPQLVVAQDGWTLPTPYMCDTPDIAPGQRMDVVIDCTEPGLWAYHCHILSHAESDHGMFGMVTVLIVSDDEGEATPEASPAS